MRTVRVATNAFGLPRMRTRSGVDEPRQPANHGSHQHTPSTSLKNLELALRPGEIRSARSNVMFCTRSTEQETVLSAGGRGGLRSFSGGAVGLEKALITGGRKAEKLEINTALIVTKTTRYQDEGMRISGKGTWQEVRVIQFVE